MFLATQFSYEHRLMIDQELRGGDTGRFGRGGPSCYLFMTGPPNESCKKWSISQEIVLNCLLLLSHNQSLWQIWGSRQHNLWAGTMVLLQCPETGEYKHTTPSQICSHCVCLEFSPPDKQFSTCISIVISKGILFFSRTCRKRIWLSCCVSYLWLASGQL